MVGNASRRRGSTEGVGARGPRTAAGTRRRGSSSRAAPWTPYIGPALVVVLVVNGAPLAYAAYLSFRRYNLADPGGDVWAGLSNYVDALRDDLVQRAFLNTAAFTVLSVSLSLIVGMLLALGVDGIERGKKIFRTVFFLPMLLAPAVIGVMWRFLLNDQAGPITWILKSLGLSGGPLSSPSTALPTVILVDVWQWTPFAFLVLLAGLEAAPREPLEAARVDGANAWQAFWHVRLPGLVPLVAIVLLFRVTWAFRTFDQIYTMTQGGPGGSTELLALGVYRSAFRDLDVGVASALAMVMFVLMALFAWTVLRSQRRGDQA